MYTNSLRFTTFSNVLSQKDLQCRTNDDETMMIMMPVDCDSNDNVSNDNDRGCGDCRRVCNIHAPAVVLLVIYDITVK